MEPQAGQPSEDGTDAGFAAPGAVARRTLVMRLAGHTYALPLESVGGVAECGALRRVPGAPATVLGLTEWQGNVLTVLDLPRLLGATEEQGPACLVRLAPPLGETALFVPGRISLEAARLPVEPPARGASPAVVGRFIQGEREVHLLDARVLLRGIGREMLDSLAREER